MATNIDQALVPMDAALMGAEPVIEIEIEDPEAVKIGIDGVEIDEPSFSWGWDADSIEKVISEGNRTDSAYKKDIDFSKIKPGRNVKM